MGLGVQSYKTRGVGLTFKRLPALFSISTTPQCLQGIAEAFLSVDLFVVFEAPLGSVVSNQLSCQAGIMLGGLLASTGLILGSFATSLKHLYLSLGVLTGKRTNLTPALFKCCQDINTTEIYKIFGSFRSMMQLT